VIQWKGLEFDERDERGERDDEFSDDAICGRARLR
jgi:hypothetical protein